MIAPGEDALAALESRKVLGVRVDATSYADSVERVRVWAKAGESRYICVCNVHMVMESHDDPDFREVVNGGDLVTPDGMPLVWCLRLLGVEAASRVYGPDLMPAVLEMAEREGLSVGLYGSTPEVLDELCTRLGERYPRISIDYVHSPPFRPNSDPSKEDLSAIANSGVRILFVALGCPKQEWWMAKSTEQVPAVMLGVGAAFDFLTGAKPQAPKLIQTLGLEWAFRLVSEPRRLWRRYAVHNPRFVAGFVRQLVRRETG